jgi:hypothetical protein
VVEQCPWSKAELLVKGSYVFHLELELNKASQELDKKGQMQILCWSWPT